MLSQSALSTVFRISMHDSHAESNPIPPAFLAAEKALLCVEGEARSINPTRKVQKRRAQRPSLSEDRCCGCSRMSPLRATATPDLFSSLGVYLNILYFSPSRLGLNETAGRKRMHTPQAPTMIVLFNFETKAFGPPPRRDQLFATGRFWWQRHTGKKNRKNKGSLAVVCN